MRLAECLLGVYLLAGLSVAADQYAFQVGKTYTYAAKGRLMAGISEINTQYAGMETEYLVKLAVTGPNTLILTPSNFKMSDTNDVLNGGWREGELRGQTPVDLPAEIFDFLVSPIEVTLVKGVVKSIKVQGNLPTWAVNIKKAQVSHFVLDTTGHNLILSGNLNRPTNHVRPLDAAADSGLFYETMEETVLGECETYYTVSQAGPFAENESLNEEIQEENTQAQEQGYRDRADQIERRHSHRRHRSSEETRDRSSSEESREQYRKYAAYKQLVRPVGSESVEDSREDGEAGVLVPELFHSFCEGRAQLYEITKTVNFTMCKNKPVLGYVSPALFYHARAGDNNVGSVINRLVYSRYIACGLDRKQLTILKIEQEEQFKFGVLRTEKTVGGTVKNLTLISILPTERVPLSPKNPKKITDLTYTFDPKEQKLRTDGEPNQNHQVNAYEDDQDEDNVNVRAYGRDSVISKKQHQRPRRSVSSSSSSSQENSQENNGAQDNEQYTTEAEREGNLPMPSMVNPPMNPMLLSQLNREEMKTRVGVLLAEIVESLTQQKSVAEAETLPLISTVAKILRFFRYSDIEELYNKHADKRQTVEDQISRNIFLDAVAIAGTNPNIKFLIDFIHMNRITGEDAAQLVMTFPLYIRTPNRQILKHFFEKLVDVRAEPRLPKGELDQVKTTSVLAFSNLLFDACVNTRSMNSRYPVALYGEFCNHNIVEREFLRPLIEQLKYWIGQVESKQNVISAKHWVTVYLTALGNVGHPAVLTEVQKLLDTVTDSYIKTKVVFVLKRLVVSRSSENIPISEMSGVDRQNRDVLTDEVVEKKVLPILMSVSFDKTEFPEVRIAAISLLTRTTSVDIAIWQQLAYMTWFETSEEVHSFVFTTLRGLASLNLNGPFPLVTWKAQLNARAVLSLAKPILGGLGKSRASFDADFVEELQSSYFHHYSQFGSADSILPSSVHFKNYHNFGNVGMGDSPTQFSLHGQTIQKLVSYFMGKFTRPNQADIEGNDAIKQIANLLHIVDREQDEEPQADLQLKLRNEMERIFSFNQETIDQFIEQLKRSYIPKLISGFPFNYQKALQMGKVSIELPTIFGIPTTFDFRHMSLNSLRGNVKVANEKGLTDVQVQLEIHPVFAWKHQGQVSFKLPFTGKKYSAGVQHHVAFEAPLRALFRKAESGHFEVAVTPGHLQEGTPSGSIQLMTFHRRPYTAIVTDEFWPVCHKQSGEMKIVHAVETPFKETRSFGQRSLAMSFRLEQMSESKPQREQYQGWSEQFMRFGSVARFFHTGLTGEPTVRLAERRLILDVSDSKTKTLFVIGTGKFRRALNRIVKDSSEERRESSESSEETSSGDQVQQQQMRHQYHKKQEENTLNYDDNEGWGSFPYHWPHFNFSWLQTQDQFSGEEQNGRRSGSGEPQRELILALIGKATPIQAPLTTRGIQKLLAKPSIPSTVQYLFSAQNRPVFVRFSAGEATKEAARQLPQTSEAVSAIREALTKSPLSNIQEPICVDYKGQYDFPQWANRNDLLVLRQRLLREDLKVTVRGQLSFGKSCINQVHNITLKGELRRDQAMTEWAQSKSPEAQKCNEDEKKGFFSSAVCIRTSEQQAAALNLAKFEIRATRLPNTLLNATIQAREFLKAQLFQYMSFNPFPSVESRLTNEDNVLKVQVRLTPDLDFLTLRFNRPESTLVFENIRTSSFVKSLVPLTATQSLKRNVMDRVFRTDSQASCSIESNFVSTFDNITYKFDSSLTNNCYHVLAQDCSGRSAVSVLAKNVGNKVLATTVLLPANFRIELIPVLRSQQNQESSEDNTNYRSAAQTVPSGGRVRVNNKPVDELPTIVRDTTGRFIARIAQAADGSLQLFADRIKLTTDGRHIVIFSSNELRNSTCGLCGNFDGEKAVEFQSPRNCPLSTGSLLMASYAFQSPNPNDKEECKVSPAVRKAIDHEEGDCQSQQYFLPAFYDNMGCKEKVSNEVGSAVYTVVRNVLKVIPGVNGKKWAEKAQNEVKDVVGKEWDKHQTGEMVNIDINLVGDVVAAAVSKMIPYLGGVMQPAVKKITVSVLTAVCHSTSCCKPTSY